MTEDLRILRAIQLDMRERYGNVRFEETDRNQGCAADVFFSRKVGDVSVFKHGFLLKVVAGRICVVPGSLLRGLLYTDELAYELADPKSLERLEQLVEECGREAPSAS